MKHLVCGWSDKYQTYCGINLIYTNYVKRTVSSSKCDCGNCLDRYNKFRIMKIISDEE